MAYLVRRLKDLLADLETGKLRLAEQVASDVGVALAAIRRGPDGDPILATVAPELRALARGYGMVKAAVEQPPPSEPGSTEPRVDEKRVTELTRELFGLYEELTAAATATAPGSTANIDHFADAVRKNAEKGALSSERWRQGVLDRMDALENFYKTSWRELFRGAQQLAGLKMVLGGKQSFRGSDLAAARSTLLYTDTLLVPDSAARWFEKRRPHEGAEFSRMLTDVFGLLQLKPLVDADLPHPAVVVFQSVERLLEDDDPVTQEALELQALDFFSHYLNATFDDLGEVFKLAAGRDATFVEGIVRNRLFVGLGGNVDDDFRTAAEKTRATYRDSRSPEFVRVMDAAPDALVAVMTILERLAPQYHLAENAQELDASPLMSLPVHWHYAQLLSSARRSGLEDSGVLKENHDTILQAMAAPEHRWLGNVPMVELVDLRRRGENEVFRSRLRDQITQLTGAGEDDLNRVVPAVGRALSKLLAEHERDVSKIADAYALKYTPQAVASWLTLAACWAPWFPTWGPTAALGLVGAYVGTKAVESVEKRRLNKTLTGILAASARSKK